MEARRQPSLPETGDAARKNKINKNFGFSGNNAFFHIIITVMIPEYTG